MPHPSTVIFEPATEGAGTNPSGESTITLIEHVLKVPFSLAFESDELHAESIVLLPSDDGKGNDNRFTGAREFDIQAEMRTDGELDIGLDLSTADRKIG